MKNWVLKKVGEKKLFCNFSRKNIFGRSQIIQFPIFGCKQLVLECFNMFLVTHLVAHFEKSKMVKNAKKTQRKLNPLSFLSNWEIPAFCAFLISHNVLFR